MENKVRYTLGKQERIKSRKTIEQLFAEGKGFSIFPFRVTWMVAREPASGNQCADGRKTDNVNGLENSNEEMLSRHPATTNRQPLLRVAFSVPRRHFKRSVDRNRIKRLMREAWRLQKKPLQDVLGEEQQLCVFLVYTGRDIPAWQQVKVKIHHAITRLQKSVHEMPTKKS